MTSRPVLMPAFGIAAALVTLTALSGCATSDSQARPAASRSPSPSAIPVSPGQPVVLPQNLPVSSSVKPTAPRILPPRSVTLAVGQSLAVQYQQSDSAVQWTPASSGDSRILRQTIATARSCPPGNAGCSPTATATYTARAAGTTTIRWSFLSRGYCPSCAQAIQTIEVTVHQ